MTDLTTDPYATPTDEEWAAIEERFDEANRREERDFDEYMVAVRVWEKAREERRPVVREWIRMQALRRPVRDYVVEQLSHTIYRRPPSASKIDPHHRPADVQQVVDDLVAEGRVRRVGKGYEWIDPRMKSAAGHGGKARS